MPKASAKSISDAGWGQFRVILACKAAWAGKRVVLVDLASTTQYCSAHGERVPRSVRVRTTVCSCSGFIANRDHTAALNMLRAGQARAASGGPICRAELRIPCREA